VFPHLTLAMLRYNTLAMSKANLDAEAINALSEQIRGGSCTLFAGTGLSIAAGLPSRNDLLSQLVGTFAAREDDPESASSLSDDDLEALFHVVAVDHRKAVAGFIDEVVSQHHRPSAAHTLLAEVEFAGVITTNWDGLLEQTFPAAAITFPDDATGVQSLLLKNSLFLLRLCGSPEKPDSLVFSRQDLEKSLATNTALISALDSLLQRHSLLFVGCTWDEIDTFFRGIRHFNPSGQHFALMPGHGATWQAKARRFSNDYHVQVIPYGGDEEMLAILSHLSSLRGIETTLRGHSEAVTALAIVSNTHFLSGSEDSSAILWDLEARRPILTLKGHTDTVNSVCVTPDRKLAITGSSDHTVCVWDLATGEMVRRIEAHDAAVRSVAVFGTPLQIATSGSDGLVKLWDVSSGSHIATLRGPKEKLDIWTVAVAPDGRIVAGGESIFIWEPGAGESPALRISLHKGDIVSLAITPDGRRLVSGSADRTVGIWSLETGNPERQCSAAGQVFSVAISPDATRVVSGSGDGVLEVWNLNNGDRIQKVEAHKDKILSVVVTTDGECVITGSDDTTIKIWKLPRTISRIRRAHFQNIGPFEDLTIDFKSNWTILLGNNGTGKSTILKALALALAGKESGSIAADPLIREHPSVQEAVITVDTDNESYRTVIRKNLGGAADVEWPKTRAIEREGMLILGFPPMRSGTRASNSSISLEDNKIPMSDDLLPLVQGVVDLRLNRLKEWIMGLAQRKNKAGDSMRPVAEVLFKKVSVLLRGTDLSFERIDNGVVVNTVDGALPIEQISQGMTSLLSWVGVLWQRLYEVYGANAEDRPAVVLMDEIDAHMHPLWQQLLVPELKKIFPNVQFIATTHSPMIVAGRFRDEVLVCTRDGERKPMMERLAMDFERLRVDQILTSPAFGLAGARDYETVGKQNRYRALVEALVLSDKEKEELASLRRDPAIAGLQVEETLAARGFRRNLDEQLCEQSAAVGLEEREMLMAGEKLARQRLISGLNS